MNCHNFDELLKHFENKIQTIEQLIPFVQLLDNSKDFNTNTDWNRNPVSRLVSIQTNSHNYSNDLMANKPDLRALSEMTIEMKVLTEDMKSLLQQQKQQIIAQNIKCENDLQLIEKQCLYINENIPAFLQKSNDHKSKSNTNCNETTNELSKTRNVYNKNETSKPTAKAFQKPLIKSNKTNGNVIPKQSQDTRPNVKSVKKKSDSKSVLKDIPTVTFITTEEFASIPSYMLGRLTYETINRAVADFNRTISSKYKLMVSHSTKSSDEEMRRYSAFKEQENSETNGEFFCTITDLKELSDLKADNIIRKILTCLRHCKRIKEIRGNPPKLIRYAIIKNLVNFENESY